MVRKRRISLLASIVNLLVTQTCRSIYLYHVYIYYYASTTQIWTHSTRKVEDLSSFQSLSVSSLPAVPGSFSDINISVLVTSRSHVQRQHLDAHKIRSQLDT